MNLLEVPLRAGDCQPQKNTKQKALKSRSLIRGSKIDIRKLHLHSYTHVCAIMIAF